MNTTAYFEAAEIDTPAGMSPSVGMSTITGIPSVGTGLSGAAFVPGAKIWNLEQAVQAATGSQVASFVTTEFGYGSILDLHLVAEAPDALIPAAARASFPLPLLHH